jgi:Flp pilus assembly pilin Flp
MASPPTPSLRHRSNRERGATLLEYALVLGLIAAVCILAVALTGTKVSKALSTVGAATGAANPACLAAGGAGLLGGGSTTTTSTIPAGPGSPSPGPSLAGC